MGSSYTGHRTGVARKKRQAEGAPHLLYSSF